MMMKKQAILFVLSGCVFLVVATLTASGEAPKTPRGAVDLLHAGRFSLEEPYTYNWCKERPKIRDGWILVVRVDKEMARPRQVNVPVLYVNHVPAHLMNVGYESGNLVMIVPGKMDLRKTLVYFGSDKLPERVDAAHGRKEMAAARQAGIRPFPTDKVRAALDKGKQRVDVQHAADLFRVMADLIDHYAPDEHDLAESFRI